MSVVRRSASRYAFGQALCAILGVLKQEGKAAASPTALSRHAHQAAGQHTAAERSAAARRAVAHQRSV